MHPVTMKEVKARRYLIQRRRWDGRSDGWAASTRLRKPSFRTDNGAGWLSPDFSQLYRMEFEVTMRP